MSEQLSQLSEADKAIHAAADAHKTNLKDGVAAHVPTGDETNKPEKVDPFAARKALFAKADKIRDAEAGELQMYERPTDEHIAAMEREAAGAAAKPAAPAAPAARDPASRGVPAGTVASVDEYANLQIEGTPVKVAKRDIERAGGEDAYIRQRTQEVRALEMEQRRAELEARERALKDREALLEQRQSTTAGNGSPAVTPGTRPGENRNGSGEGVESDEALAAKLASQLYSDEDGARSAIAQILRTARHSGENLSVDDIADRVAERLKKSAPPPQASQNAAVQRDPATQAVLASIDRMAATDYSDVCQDPVAKAATWARFTQLVRQPENKDRMAIDVARDACEWGRVKFFGNPRKDVLESKRGLPSSVTASGTIASAATEEAPAKPSDVVANIAAGRNFGRRSSE